MKRLSPLVCAFLFSFSVYSQYYEVGAYIGTSNYIGELSEQRLSTKDFNNMLGIYGKYNATKYLSLKASVTKGTLTGSDENAKQAENKARNLNFRTDILEFAVTSEVNLGAYNIRDAKTGVPYFFSGIAITHFNPEAQMRGSWYSLQPFKTEGKKYGKNVVSIPFGLGMKFNLSYKLNFGLEIGARKTFTDYLDDVSSVYPDIIELRRTDPTSAALSYRSPEITGEFGQNPIGLDRGNPGNNDWYFFGGLTISVNLTDKYGLDFDPQYDELKEHLKKPSKEKQISRRQKKAKFQEKLRLRAKKNMLQPQVKKRSNQPK